MTRPACTLCDRDPGDGCTPGARFVTLAGVEHARWVNGAEPGSIDDPDLPCPVCGTPVYGFHHDPCLLDRCPHGPGGADCLFGCRLMLPGELATEREAAVHLGSRPTRPEAAP